MDKIKRKIKEKIDEFLICNTDIMDTATNSEPYYSLDDCNSIDEIMDYLDDYQFNIENAKTMLDNFIATLEDLIAWLEEK